jgi:two-component system chemotaxis response regulator CheY
VGSRFLEVSRKRLGSRTENESGNKGKLERPLEALMMATIPLTLEEYDMADAPITVLITDDDPLVRATYRHPFEEAGYRVLEADDGRKVMKHLTHDVIDILLLDVFMPDQDGLETLLEVKRKFPTTKVIVMSGGGMSGRYEFLEAARKFGATGAVRKPISPRLLLDMIQRNDFSS